MNTHSAHNLLITRIEEDQARRSVNFQIIAEQKEEIEPEIPNSQLHIVQHDQSEIKASDSKLENVNFDSEDEE